MRERGLKACGLDLAPNWIIATCPLFPGFQKGILTAIRLRPFMLAIRDIPCSVMRSDRVNGGGHGIQMPEFS
jgi:hypothetical protein